jgi:integrase/recombinase XerC
MQERNNKNSTINKNIGVLKTLVSFLIKHDLIQSINFKVDKLKETSPNIKILDLECIKLIVNYIKKFSNRKQLIFYLFASTGIRRTELVYIKKSNINLNNNSIYLEHTKSGHARFIYFSEMVKDFIINELNKHYKSDYLFCEENGYCLSTAKIDQFFKKIKNDLKLESFSPHILRHTYATAILKQTDLETVRLLLGHQTYEMTKKYLHLENSKLKTNSILFNPLDSIFKKIN